MHNKLYKGLIDVLLAILFILGSILLINILGLFTSNYMPDCSTMEPELNINPLFFIQQPIIFKISESTIWILSLLFPVLFYFLSANRSRTGEYKSWQKLLPFVRVIILILLTILFLLAGALLTDLTITLPFIAIFASLTLLYIYLFKKDSANLVEIIKVNLYLKILIVLIIFIFYITYLYNLMWFTSIEFPCMGGLPAIGS